MRRLSVVIAVLTVLMFYAYGEAGTIEVYSDPSEASVYIDGEYVGDTPYKNDKISSGKHRILVVPEDDYISQYRYMTVSGPDPMIVRFSLEKKDTPEECIKVTLGGTCWRGYWKGYGGKHNEPMYLFFTSDEEARLRLFEDYPIYLEDRCSSSLFKNKRGNVIFSGSIREGALEIETFNYAFMMRTTVILDKIDPAACNFLTEKE